MRKLLLLVVVGACAALGVSAGSAQAASKLFFGFAEDTPKWAGEAAVTPARALGAAAFRITVPWKPGETHVSAETANALDQAVTAAFGLRVVFAVYGEASAAPRDAEARSDYCAYARALLERYPTVNDVIVWNEPNSSRFWSPQFNRDGTSAAPHDYTALLAHCWDVLHAFRHDVNVLAPATSAHGFDEHGAPRKSHSPVNFIVRMGEAYRGSGRDLPLFDTVAHHAYGLTAAERPWKRHDGQVVSLGDWDKLVAALRLAFAGTEQPLPGYCVRFDCVGIWYMEVGYQVAPDAARKGAYRGTETDAAALPAVGGGDPPGTVDADSPAPDQATQIVDAVRLAYCQPYVEAFFNFLLRDEIELRAWQSGVQWADGGWKPSMPAFRQAIGEAHDGAVNCTDLKGGPVARLDTAAPAAPSGVTASARADAVLVRWQPGAERDIAGYHVYRAPAAAGPYTRVTGLVRARRYLDTAVPAGATPFYFAAAVDSSGNESPLSTAARP